jgi:hypothetical protein
VILRAVSRATTRAADDESAAVAAEAAHAAGIGSAVQRQRDGSTNGVFVAGDAVLIVARRGTPPGSMAARVALGRALSAEAPVVRPRPGLEQPLVVRGREVTVWDRVPVVKGPLDWYAVGKALRALHAVGVDVACAPGRLRDADDLSELGARLDRLRHSGFPAWEVDVFAAVAERLASELGPRAGAPVVLHGDLHEPNILATEEGVVLCDLDEVAAGHRDHDLGFLVDPGRPTLQGAEDRERFERGYGGALPSAARARTVARLAHLRRTIQLAESRDPGLREAYYRRLRSRSWQDVLKDWSLDLHPVVVQARGAQLLRLARPIRHRPS